MQALEIMPKRASFSAKLKMVKKTESREGEIVIAPEVFEDMVKLRNDFESIIETIEIMNNKELMAGIKRSKADFEAGRVHKLKSVDNLFGG